MNFDQNKLDKSVKIGNLSFSNRDDYAQYLVNYGFAADPNEIWINEDLVKAIHSHWHGMGQNGCIFALLAAREERTPWNKYVFCEDLARLNSQSTVKKIDVLIQQAIEDDACEIISLLFPQITSFEEIAELILILSKTDSIFISNKEEIEDKITISLRVEIASEILSWVMAFADLGSFPITRKSPITEVTIRVKPKPEEQFYRLTPSEKEAHLADLTIPYETKIAERIWDNTLNRTRLILGEEPNIFSAAKTTFTLPLDLRHFFEDMTI